MSNIHYITSDTIDLNVINDILIFRKKLQLSTKAQDSIVKCRTYLDTKMASHKDPIYGINTGFGSLYNVKINSKNLTKLQENLMKSHACGTGDEVPRDIVKLMLLLKIQSLSYGHSGSQLETVNRLIDFPKNRFSIVVFKSEPLV